jgi:hypothetical protein
MLKARNLILPPFMEYFLSDKWEVIEGITGDTTA